MSLYIVFLPGAPTEIANFDEATDEAAIETFKKVCAAYDQDLQLVRQVAWYSPDDDEEATG